MDREPLTETIGKRLVTTIEIEITNDVDDADVSIGASPKWEVVEQIAL
jgi:hypothetical protein